MYIPDLYKNENQEEIQNFLHENGFAILVNQTNGKLWATHIPLILDKNDLGKDILVGHVSKENPQGESFSNNTDVLAVFSGPHSYISSSWYDHENVPTWNYLAVHVYGKAKVLNHDEAVNSLKKLVDKYEKNSKKPVRVEDLSKKTMMEARGIIAFEIEITSIEAVKKISQNRDKKNHENIISELENTGDFNAKQIASEMKKSKKI
ncbi:FMN-binding negative transcriptional regulator [Flavobacterium sp.]|uniref:FMN-binding negative transcriptional regulator n=1 Tax=Flavobacterium sp. TaxID=239 RepID=UPI0026206F7F|nr:FMN-binding negative transcriptional regulator [Flavobacterium sp.]